MLDELSWKVHADLPRQGPGNKSNTWQALQVLRENGLPKNPKILDVGCGPGTCHITAVDNHQPFLDTLRRKSGEQNLSQMIDAKQGDMFNLEFQPGSFDYIHAEGSIYIIGFEKGLTDWKHLLKPNGFVAVTEISWIAPDPPSEVLNYWTENYPKIMSKEGNLKIVERCGYKILGSFTLPKEAWLEEYYDPMAESLRKVEEEFKDDEELSDKLKPFYEEINMYKKYSDYYSYVFYVMQLQ